MSSLLIKLLKLSTLFSACTLASPTTSFYQIRQQSSSSPLLPSQDDFYTPPQGYESTAPGTILRLRSTPLVANASAGYKILYRTTDAGDQPTWAVTTFFAPLNTTTSTPMVTYNIPYNTDNIDASPSYSIYTLFANPLADALADVPPFSQAISDALGLSWYVNVPDYEGSRAPAGCGAGRLGGHATLDSIRAVMSAQLGPDQSMTRHAMWGYSGGAQAAEFAVEMRKTYAPELQFAGAALGGLAPNMTNTADSITGTFWAGLMPPGVIGVASQYPGAYDYLVSKLKPGLVDAFLRVKKLDMIEAFLAFAYQDIYGYFEGGRDVFFEPSPLNDALTANGYMGLELEGAPEMPLFVYKAVHDQFSPVEDTDRLIEGFCGKGATILYQRNSVGGHLAEITNGYERALGWLGLVLDGSHQQQVGCVVQNVTIEIKNSPT